MKIRFLFLSIYILLNSISVFSQDEPCARYVEPNDFQFLIDSLDNELIIDVRPNEMFKNQIIENAILLPTKDELNVFCDTIDRETPIFVYCAIGIRSEKVCEILCEKSFNFVINLNGGIDSWKKKGFNTIELEKE